MPKKPNLHTLIKDTIGWGVALVLGSEVAVALLLFVLIHIVSIFNYQFSFFGACFIPPILILRYLARKGPGNNALKGAIISLFVTFIAFMFFFLKNT